MTETLSLFFAMMAVGGGLAVLGILVGSLLVRFQLPGADLAHSMAAEIRPFALFLAFVAAAGSMAGSLYYSEGAGYLPCRMCWFQRYAMYPSALLLAVSLVSKRHQLAQVAWGLSAVGICISIYHRLEQAYPDSVGGVCESTTPCSSRWVNEFGFITIPTMAGVAFALVLVLVPLSRQSSVSRQAQTKEFS